MMRKNLSQIKRLGLFLCAILVLTAPFELAAQEDAAEQPAAPNLPPDFTPPSPPPGPPPELPEFIRNRSTSRARPDTAVEQARASQEAMEAGQADNPPVEDRALRRRTIPIEGDPPTPVSAEAAPEEIVNELIFSDMSALEVIQVLEELTGKAVIRQQSVPAVKINFNSRGPMAKSEAITAVVSLLSLNGIAVTDLGEKFLKVVPSANVAQQVPIFIDGSTLQMMPSQGFYTKLFQLEYLDVQKEAQPLIQQMMSTGGNGVIVPFNKTNSIMVTDALINLQRIESLLRDADRPQISDDEVLFFQLENVKASDLQARINAIIQNQNSAFARYFQNNTTIEADERTNQLIVLTHRSNQKIIRELVDKLDVDVDPLTTSRVFYIKHAKAVEISALLKEVISGQQQVMEDRAAAAGNRPQAEGNRTPSNTVTVGQLSVGGVRFSEYITIVADERSNAVVAYGTEVDLEQIAKLIEEIDVLLAQVHIEVIIAEVKLRDSQVSGIDAIGLEYNPIDGLSGLSGSIDGAAFDFFGAVDTDTVTLAIDNSIQEGITRVLSAPVIVTTHNQEASINVSESRPFITGGITTQDGSTTGTVTNEVQYRDVGIQLKVTPLIGNNGVVQMEIEQVVETIVPNAGVVVNGVEQPFIDKREATSFISVTDNEIIILAGLQQSEIGDTRTRLWLLGDIPLLGDWLFSSQRDSDTRRELMMFIKPYVIYSQRDASKGADLALDKLDNGEDARFFMKERDMSAVYEREKDKQDEENTNLIKPRSFGRKTN